MGTFTASQLSSAVINHHGGVIAATGTRSDHSATATASSQWWMVKVPLGATIVDWMWSGSDGAPGQTYKLGLRYPHVDPNDPHSNTHTVTESVLSSDLSFTGGQQHRGTNAKLPVKVSFSNDWVSGENYAWVIATNAAGISATASHRFTVFYTMDHRNQGN